MLLVTVLTVMPGYAAEVPAPGGAPLRIGVGRGLATAQVQGDNGFAVIDAAGRVLLNWPPAQALDLSLSPLPAGGTTLLRQVQGGLPGGPAMFTSPGPLTLRPLPMPGTYLKFKGRSYQGDLEVRAVAGDKLSVINLIPLEEYLRGVVPLELGAGQPAEALKAQAVAARTYALNQRGKNKVWTAEGFDLTDDTSAQAYGGAGAHAPQTDAAIAATRSLVVTYGNQLITTFYFSSSGGYTEDNEAVFGSGQPIPYLRGVPDFDQGTTHYSWEVRRTPAELLADLRNLEGFPDIGAVVAVEPAGKRGAGGRWSHWKIRGERGEHTVTGSQMRWQLNLRSNPRAVGAAAAAGPAPTGPVSTGTVQIQPGRPVAVAGAYGQTATLAAGAVVAVAGGRSPVPALLPAAGAWVQGARPVASGTAAAGGTAAAVGGGAAPVAFLIQGGGNGHGVGMSQYGAVAMAKQGRNFIEILTHYYTGAQVQPYAGQ